MTTGYSALLCTAHAANVDTHVSQTGSVTNFFHRQVPSRRSSSNCQRVAFSFPPLLKVGQQQVGARKQCVAVKYTHTQPTFPVFSQMTYCPFNRGRGLLGWSCNLVWAEHRSVHSGPIHKQDITVRIESSHNRLYFVLSSSSGPDVRGEPEPDMFTSSGHCGPPREQLWLPMADPAVDGFDFMYAARSASEPSSAPEECFGRFQTLILAFASREWID